MTRRLGIGSYAYAWAIGAPGHPPEQPMTALDLVERTAELGVGLVQICDNVPLHQMPAAELDALRARARTLGVDIEVGTLGLRRDHLRTYLRLAERFESPILRVVVDSPGHQPDDDEIVRTINSLKGDLRAAGVTLAIENHDRFKANDLACILERVGSDHVGICLDTVNSFGALEGPEVVVAELASHTVSLHIKDFHIERVPSRMGFVLEGRPAGQGQLNVPWLLEKMRGNEQEANAILELWPPLQATLQETIRLEDDWARQSVAYLRGLIAG
jgi:sugar phosphate isomerase/epimerase